MEQRYEDGKSRSFPSPNACECFRADRVGLLKNLRIQVRGLAFPWLNMLPHTLTATGPPAVQLSEEQQLVLKKVQAGQNVFFTGSAGTGKSLLLRLIIKWFRDSGLPREAVAITSSTGMAATNIHGTTIYAWAGIGMGYDSVEDLLRNILGERRYNKRAGLPVEDYYDEEEDFKSISMRRWESCQVLILDESKHNVICSSACV